ncbi:1-acyl-sn-glycerol-3-phosphate acyltransferase alpha-like [Paramacrobiotus metropolitanus]|uniref:1-acyl-sn-glycerol-3-phosphate acyltransferase alpha-like n=1 Tax=Paramacrobiotus metropolitanus TaxID=2943436 RepID=UPI00244567A0|nr:1-acyl-sn-glycerol-3-phosphate acyltransferase alpha-like [Paramacrobiotus metropolitanus]
MEPEISKPESSLGIVIFQYFCIALTVIIPVIWKLYDSSPAFRYQAKMFFYMTIVYLTSSLVIPLSLKDPRNPDNTRSITGWLFLNLLRGKELFGIQVEKRGEENFRKAGDGSYVVISNHQSSLDMIPLFDVVPERCTVLAKKALLFAGPFGLACWLCGGIFVDRRPGKGRGTMDGAASELKKKNARIWIFPEGTRNHGDGLLPFKKGAFHLALQAKVPIVPIVVSSYKSFYDKKTWKFETGKMITTVLPPIDTSAYSVDTINDLIEKARNEMMDVFIKTSKEIDPNFVLDPYDGKADKRS